MRLIFIMRLASGCSFFPHMPLFSPSARLAPRRPAIAPSDRDGSEKWFPQLMFGLFYHFCRQSLTCKIFAFEGLSESSPATVCLLYVSLFMENTEHMKSSIRLSIAVLLGLSFGVMGGAHPALIPQTTDTDKVQGRQIDTSSPLALPDFQGLIAKPGAGYAPYGLYTWMWDWCDHWHITKDFKGQLTKVGLKMYRIASGYGEMMQDGMMKNVAAFCSATNSQVMYTLYAVEREYFGAFGVEANDQAFIEAYLGFADRMIGRFGPNGTFFSDPTYVNVPKRPILYWEILNEPNLHYMTGANSWNQLTEAGKADLYARVLIAVHRYVRANPKWSEVKIVAGASCLGGDTAFGKSFVQMVHERIAALTTSDSPQRHPYDVYSEHPYIHDGPPDANYSYGSYSRSIPGMHAQIRSVMDQYGNAGKPIWFTEVGWGRVNGSFSSTTMNSNLPPLTERLQAAYMTRLYLISLRLGVGAVHAFNITDADTVNGGFIDVTDTSHLYEQAIAAQNLVKLLPNPKFVRSISDGTNGYFAYVLDADSNVATSDETIVAWNVKAPLTVNLPCQSGTYTITDMLGNTESRVNSGTALGVGIGPYPIYLRRASGTGIDTVPPSPPQNLRY
jgi:hypothetical protein